MSRMATWATAAAAAAVVMTAWAAPALRAEERSARPAIHPALAGQRLAFVVRHAYARDHHNTATFFPAAEHEYNDGRFAPGGALKVLDVASGRVATLLETPGGVIRDLEVHPGGARLLFSMRRDAADSYHVYEVNADGTGLRQLTRMKDVDDLDPAYLPDGTIVFSSTREPKYCACNRHIMANLFRMEADGANVRQIGKSTLFEGHASVMPDGRILYDRWEYVDRNFGDAQALWTCNPDGTNHAVYWGNNTPAPGGVIDGRAVPGTDLVVCTFTSCHDRPWGAIAIIDPKRGLDGRAAVVRTWPADAAKLVKDPGTANNAWDAFMGLKVKYEDPYPLDGRFILCSRVIGQGERTGIYLLDAATGEETLVHAEGPGCYDPMPLAQRAAGRPIAARAQVQEREGTFYVQDVYLGTHMRGVRRGSVRWLRVVESPEKRFWTRPTWDGQGIEGPAINWHDFGTKRVLGTVPVEADGSAYFAAPAEAFVYFQLLDADGMMVQSMRSGTMVQGGERSSCIGCHEDRRTAPPAPSGGVPMALRRAPSRLEGWGGRPPREFSYLRDVQPVWDARCISCHTHGKEKETKLNLEGDRGMVFNASYAEIWRKKAIRVAGAGPAEILQAYSWGSHASTLVKVLRAGHYEVKLAPEEFERVVTWVDLNAPYYPSFATAFPEHPFGRSPIDGRRAERLSGLLGFKLNDPAMLSFDRPERSPALAGLKEDDPRRAEALAILRQGREALLRTPNPDAEGFEMCVIDRWREEKYARRVEAEARSRRAMAAGEKVYDPDR